MKSTSELIVDNETSHQLNVAANTTLNNLKKTIELLDIRYDEFYDFIVETHQANDPIAQEILDSLSKNRNVFPIFQFDKSIGDQRGLEWSINTAFTKDKKTHALIIGCNFYQNKVFSSLPSVKRDAEAIYSTLTQTYSNVNVNLLVGNQATSENIRSKLIELSKNVTDDDTVCIYFAGHVLTQKELNIASSYFCARDAEIGNLRKTAIAFSELRNITSNILADRLLFVFDAFLPMSLPLLGMRNVWDEVGTAYESLLSRSGEALIAINRNLKTQVEETSKHITLYSSYFLDALEGETRDIVRMRNLYYQIRKKVEEQKPNVGNVKDDVLLLQYNSEEKDFAIFEK